MMSEPPITDANPIPYPVRLVYATCLIQTASVFVEISNQWVAGEVTDLEVVDLIGYGAKTLLELQHVVFQSAQMSQTNTAMFSDLITEAQQFLEGSHDDNNE